MSYRDTFEIYCFIAIDQMVHQFYLVHQHHLEPRRTKNRWEQIQFLNIQNLILLRWECKISTSNGSETPFLYYDYDLLHREGKIWNIPRSHDTKQSYSGIVVGICPLQILRETSNDPWYSEKIEEMGNMFSFARWHEKVFMGNTFQNLQLHV